MNDIGPWEPGMYLYAMVGPGYINWTDVRYGRATVGCMALGEHIDVLPEPDASLDQLHGVFLMTRLRWITRDDALALIAAARARHALENAP